MCGISGIYYKNNAFLTKETLRHFTDSMSHRGQDGAGYEVLDEGHLGLGQRRLSILDLSDSGKQPMSYADERYWITYNGEIFNFLEVREELQTLGHTFKSDTDTEVILASYAQWGKACLDKFNGMWAFAIWDVVEKSLFLARDRFGIKPLYYVHRPNRFFAFASETRAFKFLEGFKREIDIEKVKEVYAGVPYEGLGLTIYKEIYQLLPGHYMFVTKEKSKISQTRWYDIRDKIKVKNTNDYAANVQIFKDIFMDACSIRMRSDVPLASALSGGLDSSSVYSMVHYLSQQGETNERQAVQYKKAITATFPGTPMDEKEYAEIVANKWGKENWVCVESDLKDPVKEIEKTTRLFDAVSGAAMNSISKIYEGVRKEGVIVSLDGHGVDEMLYGYRYMLDKLFYHYLKSGVLDKANSIKEALVNLYKEEDRAVAATRFDKLIKETAIQQKSFKTKIKKWLKPYRCQDSVKLSKVDTPPSIHLYDFSSFPYEQQILLNDFFIDSLPTFLRDFDRASMQHSVEVRMPFMDYRLVEFCFSLPLEQKLDKGFTKIILRDAMKGIVPNEIIDRTFKVGISSPLLDWFKGELKEYIIDQLHSEELKVRLVELGFLTTNQYLSKLRTNQLTSKEVSDIWFALNLKLIG